MSWLLKTIAPPLGALYLDLVRLTGRYAIKGQDNLDRVTSEYGRSVWVVWHNRLLAAIALHKGRNVGALISRSDDGELIARVVNGMGYTSLRGSSSRGAAAALRAIFKHLKDGYDVVITPDGPRGPRYVVQKGAAIAAMRSGMPVLPIGVGASSKVVFRSWDRFQLPLPFSRVQVVYGEPLVFAGDESMEEIMLRIGQSLEAVTCEADSLLGVTSP